MHKAFRREARELALKMIYSLPDHPDGTESLISDFWNNFRFEQDIRGEAVEDTERKIPLPVKEYAQYLMEQLLENCAQVDRIISGQARNWTLERMARVDLALLRLGVCELLVSKDVPVSVIINEAVEIGKCFGSRETPSFINGILDKVAKKYRVGSLEGKKENNS